MVLISHCPPWNSWEVGRRSASFCAHSGLHPLRPPPSGKLLVTKAGKWAKGSHTPTPKGFLEGDTHHILSFIIDQSKFLGMSSFKDMGKWKPTKSQQWGSKLEHPVKHPIHLYCSFNHSRERWRTQRGQQCEGWIGTMILASWWHFPHGETLQIQPS